MIDYTILILCVLLAGAMLATAKCLLDINELNKQIDKILVEEKRQNKRIDILEKREQVRQAEERRDKAFIEANELFDKW